MKNNKDFRDCKMKIYKAMVMLQTAHRQKRTTGGLLRISGGIELAQMFLEEAKEFLNKVMDEHEKLSRVGTVQASVATVDAQ